MCVYILGLILSLVNNCLLDFYASRSFVFGVVVDAQKHTPVSFQELFFGSLRGPKLKNSFSSGDRITRRPASESCVHFRSFYSVRDPPVYLGQRIVTVAYRGRTEKQIHIDTKDPLPNFTDRSALP